MNTEHFIAWLIHSDWYLAALWAVLLGAAALITMTDLPVKLLRSATRDRELPPA